MSQFKKVFVTDEVGGNTVDVKENSNTASNELLVNLEGHECSGNTTTTPLGIDGVFTGSSWQDTLDYGVLSISVYSDQDSATDGLQVQWSDDGITSNGNNDVFTILADTPKTFTFGPAERYYRIVYTNGGVAQTSFHLTSLLRRCYVKSSSHRINDVIVGQDDAELVKANLTGKTDEDVFVNIGASRGGALHTTIFDNETGKRTEVDALGQLKTVKSVNLIGNSFSGDTKDTNFWTETVVGSGSVTQSGEVLLATGETANSSATYQTVRKARKVSGTVNQFRSVARLVTDPQVDNLRRLGAYNGTDGAFF